MLIGLAKQLGLKTVAEWVQDEAGATLLTEWGCDYLQGPRSSVPQPPPRGVAASAFRRTGRLHRAFPGAAGCRHRHPRVRA